MKVTSTRSQTTARLQGLGYSFLIRYRTSEKGRPSELSESVYCATAQEARQWMMRALDDLRISHPNHRVIEARTYRTT